MSNRVFVFGSNLAGRHGAGSAKEALLNHGAIYGKAQGPQGNSYAIPTKDAQLKSLPLHEIEQYVISFCSYADYYDDKEFDVVAIGCGLAGYTPEQIAPMFEYVGNNVHLPKEFIDVLQNRKERSTKV